MSKEIFIKRLSTIKLLFRIGLEQSRKADSVSIFSILTFHDAVEMFLKLASEERNVKSDKFNFMDYWDHMTDLTLKESMRNLNSRRVNLKHKGLVPGQVEVEASRVNTTDFFIQNTPLIFGVDFKDVSLIELVKFPKTREYLTNAQSSIDLNSFEKCVEESTKAFHELIHEYKETKKRMGGLSKTHFDFAQKIRYDNRNTWGQITDTDKRVEKLAETISKNFENIEKALSILALGIDYRKFAKFNDLTPHAYRMSDGNYRVEIYGQRNWTRENCEYLIDFILECSFKLQEVDFDHGSFDTTTFDISIVE